MCSGLCSFMHQKAVYKSVGWCCSQYQLPHGQDPNWAGPSSFGKSQPKKPTQPRGERVAFSRPVALNPDPFSCKVTVLTLLNTCEHTMLKAFKLQPLQPAKLILNGCTWLQNVIAYTVSEQCAVIPQTHLDFYIKQTPRQLLP